MGARSRILTLCAILLAATPRSAAADWQFTPFIGITFRGDTTIVDLEDAARRVHWNFGGAVTLIGAGPLGVEGIFVYTPGFFENKDISQEVPSQLPVVTSSRTLALMGNVVVASPRKWNEYGLRPFLSGGLGLLRASQTNQQNLLPVKQNLLGYNVGGGATGFVTDHTGLRFELRYFSNLRPSDELVVGVSFGRVHLSYWTGSVGVVLRY